MSKRRIVESKQVSHAYNEKSIMFSLKSPFFVRLYSTFQNSQSLFMVMEFVNGGEIFTYMKKHGRFTVPVTKFYATEIVLALEHLHSLGVVYRDLKPENILIGEDGHIKLADFGFSKRVLKATWTLCGTPEYIAPEIILNEGHGLEVDFWSLGIIIYEMIVGVPPFYHENQVELCGQIIRGKIGFPPFVDAITRDLIKKLVEPDRRKRLGVVGNGMATLKRHPFFRGVSWGTASRRETTPPIIPKVESKKDSRNFDFYPETGIEEDPAVSVSDQYAGIFDKF